MRSVTTTGFQLQKVGSPNCWRSPLSCTKQCFMSVPGSKCQQDFKWDCSGSCLTQIPKNDTYKAYYNRTQCSWTAYFNHVNWACHQGGSLWNDCQRKRSSLFSWAELTTPFLLMPSTPSWLSTAGRLVFSFSRVLVPGLTKGEEVFNCGQFCISEDVLESQMYGQTIGL